jgi:uncharacterized protein (TIGR04255 family)
MPVRFAKPPLVELMAEFRWPVSGQTMAIPGAVGPLMLNTPEEFFMRFGAKVAVEGYSRVERIVPPGFPSPAFQIVYRFRKASPEQGTTLYQLGPGVFSANITPPYHSWAQFRPVVEKGLEILLECRDAGDRSEFAQVGLRYIDRFGPEWTAGHSVIGFMRDVLGFNLSLPASIAGEVGNLDEIQPMLQFRIPLRPGQTMAILLAHGQAGTETGVIYDTTVTTTGPLAATREAVMASLDAAHEVMHRSFVEMTRAYHHIMEPIGEDAQ